MNIYELSYNKANEKESNGDLSYYSSKIDDR